jgi:hypothetical protein
MRKSFLAVLTLGTPLTCHAVDYFVDPVFKASQQYATNLFMRTTPLQDNWVSILSPGLNFGLRHETGALNSNFTWNHRFYNNESKLDVDEQQFGLDYQHSHDRLSWKFNGSYNNQASVNTVNDGTVLGVPGALNQTQVMSKRIGLSPSVTYALDERSALSFNYSYNKVSFDKNKNSFLSNYDYHQVSGTYDYLYTERDKLNATLSSSRYSSALQNQLTWNHVAQLGWQHNFNEHLVASVSGGLNYSQVESTVQHCALNPNLASCPPFPQAEVTNKKNGIGQIFSASIQKTFERGRISLSVSQNQTPTTLGLLTQSQFSISNDFSINEQWTTGLSANYSTFESTVQSSNQSTNNQSTNNQSTSNQSNRSNRTNYSISPHINWKLSNEINFDLSYNYREQKFKDTNQSSVGNTVQLQFSYQPEVNRQVK